MKQNVTFTMDKKGFVKIGAPRFSYLRISFQANYFKIPTNLILGKVYYHYGNDTLKAFKVLAYAVNDEDAGCNHKRFCLNYLVQTPDGKVEWEKDFINESKKVYESKEQFICNGGNKCADLGWCTLANLIGRGDYVNFKDKVFENIRGVITNAENAKIEYMVYTNDGWSVCIASRKNYEVFLSYDDCLKATYNGLEIEDFGDTTIKIDIKVEVSKPIVSTLKIIEF